MEQNWRKRAKLRMKEIGETQNTLSEKLDMTQGGLQHWLSGSREPSLENIIRIAGLLRCSPAWLLLGMQEDDHINGLPGAAQAALRQLIRAELATPLPPTVWQGLALMVPAAPPGANDGASSTPTTHTAPRNGTHG